jgi:hypothetical protein
MKTDHETLGRFGNCRHVLYGNSNNAEGTPPTESLLPWYLQYHGIKYCMSSAWSIVENEKSGSWCPIGIDLGAMRPTMWAGQ